METDGDTNGCTFQWKIENISVCLWFQKKDRIESPAFIANELEDTKWSLGLYPLGNEVENYIGIYLKRKEDCSGPDVIEVNYQLAFVDKDGSILRERTGSGNIKKGEGWGFSKFVGQERVFLPEREAFLLDDTLTVQCTLWKKEETLLKSKSLYGRTVLKVHRKSFDWIIEKFSTVKPGVRNKFKDDLIEFDLVLNQDSDKKLDIDMISFNNSIKYISCNTSIMNKEGIRENCDIKRYFHEDLKKGILSPTLHFSKELMGNKTRYLPNDVLTLDFEFILSTVEQFGCGKICPKLESEVVGKDKSHSTAVLIYALKSLCNDEIFCDTELRTSTKTFPAHKAILSARSPVFKNMFSHDMKEKNSGHVDITDFEDDTIHRMLLYIYTASLEDLQLESASKLYAAADKYDILSLKCRCSSFLKQNLCPANACDILVLADLHNDDDLKIFVQDYILGQRKQIFCSQEWKDFMNTHIKLAADVMYKKIYEE